MRRRLLFSFLLSTGLALSACADKDVIDTAGPSDSGADSGAADDSGADDTGSSCVGGLMVTVEPAQDCSSKGVCYGTFVGGLYTSADPSSDPLGYTYGTSVNSTDFTTGGLEVLLDGLTCGSYTLWGYHETGAGDINALDGVDDDDLVATARTLEIVEGPRAEETLTLE